MNDSFRWTLKEAWNENAVYFESEDLGVGFVTWKEVLAMKDENLFGWPVVFLICGHNLAYHLGKMSSTRIEKNTNQDWCPNILSGFLLLL